MAVRSTQTVGGVAAAILERWRVMLVVVLATLAAAGVLIAVVPPRYSSTSTVQVAAMSVNPLSNTLSPVDMETERIVGGSEVVAARVAERLADGTTAQSLQSSLVVGNPSSSQILRFEVRRRDPGAAARTADLFAEEYLANRVENTQSVADEVADRLTRQIALLEGRRANASGTTLEDLNRQISSLRGQEVTLATLSFFGGRIVGRAVAPSSPVGPGPEAYLAAAVALGLLAGAFLALLFDRFDPRVRNARRYQQHFLLEVHDIRTAGDEVEAARAILVAARAARTIRGVAGNRPLSVAVLSASTRAAEDVGEAFAAASRDLGLHMQPASAAGAGGEARADRLAIADASGAGSPTLQVAAAVGADAAVILASHRDPRRVVEHLVDGLSSEGVTVSVGWLRDGARVARRRGRRG